MGTSETKPANLWDHLTPEEVERLRGLAKAEENAEAEVRRIAGKLEEVERTLTGLSARRYANTLAAAARALGETPPVSEQPAASVDRGELEEQAAGLRVRLVEAEDLLKRQRGAYRSAFAETVRAVCVDRLAPEYVRLVKELEGVMSMLMGAEDFALNIAPPADPGKVRHVFPRELVAKAYIPGMLDVPAVAKHCHEDWGVPVLFTGSHAFERGLGAAALARFKESATKATGGRWPFNP